MARLWGLSSIAGRTHFKKAELGVRVPRPQLLTADSGKPALVVLVLDPLVELLHVEMTLVHFVALGQL